RSRARFVPHQIDEPVDDTGASRLTTSSVAGPAEETANPEGTDCRPGPLQRLVRRDFAPPPDAAPTCRGPNSRQSYPRAPAPRAFAAAAFGRYPLRRTAELRQAPTRRRPGSYR